MVDEWFRRNVRLDTTEAFVYKLAFETAVWSEFHIEYIRWDAFFNHDTSLSYAQVRNALFRLRRKGAKIRHIARGTYRWIS